MSFVWQHKVGSRTFT